jgi:hypothetical protein
MTVYIQKWTPFRYACALKSLQQGVNNVNGTTDPKNRQINRNALAALAIAEATTPTTGWAKWRVGFTSRTSTAGLMLNVPLVPGFVSPAGTVDDGT